MYDIPCSFTIRVWDDAFGVPMTILGGYARRMHSLVRSTGCSRKFALDTTRFAWSVSIASGLRDTAVIDLRGAWRLTRPCGVWLNLHQY